MAERQVWRCDTCKKIVGARNIHKKKGGGGSCWPGREGFTAIPFTELRTPSQDAAEEIAAAINWWETELNNLQRDRLLEGKPWEGSMSERHVRLLGFYRSRAK